jgi:prevent-host-death family protein
MTITVGVFDAKTRLSELLDKVNAGEEVIITKRGHAIARLVAMDDGSSAVEAALAALLEVRARALPGTETIRELIDEGRRW